MVDINYSDVIRASNTTPPTGNTLANFSEQFFKAMGLLREYASYVKDEPHVMSDDDIKDMEQTKSELVRCYRALTYLIDEIQAPTIDILMTIHKIIGDDDAKK